MVMAHELTMKAYTIKNYGAPDKVLKLLEAEQPAPKNTEVQLKVIATTINDYDWCITTGKPFAYRLISADLWDIQSQEKIKDTRNGGSRHCGAGRK
jgi:hypothetical protein